MLILCFFLLGVFLLVLQTALFPFMPSWIGNPDLLFILVIFLGCKMDIIRGALLVFLFGLMMDTFSGFFLGLYPITYLSLFFAIKGLSKFTTLGDGIYQPPLAAASYLLSCSAIFVLSWVLIEENMLNWTWGVILLHFILVSILSLPCFAAFEDARIKWSKKPSSWKLFKKKKQNRFKYDI